MAFKGSSSLAANRNVEGESSKKLGENFSITFLLEERKGISWTLVTKATESKFPSVGIMMDVDLK